MKLSKISYLFSSLIGAVVLFLPLTSVQASMPFNFVGSAGSTSGTVQLNWTDSSNVANSYSLMYGSQPGQYLWGASVIPEFSQNNSFTVGYLNPGQTYYFVLNANQNGNFVATTGPIAVTAASGTTQVITSLPTNPWVANPTFGFWATTGSKQGTITLTWSDPQNLANNYAIVYGTTPAASMWGALNIPETAGGNTYTVGALTSGQTYYFTLFAYQGGTFVKQSAAVVFAAAK